MAIKQDLVGLKFGKLTVLSEIEERKHGRVCWLCLCDCGNLKEVEGRLLKNEAVSSCGCLINKHKINNVSQQVFGRLTVVKEAMTRKNDGHVAWLCACSCGESIIVSGHSLRSGTTTSCGCLAKELAAERFSTHNKSGTGTYQSWICMRNRCYYKKDISYKYYGERGITVCDRWLDSFENFYEDMGDRPDGKSIDRINNEGNYEPTNCKWSTAKEQANNTRRNKK